jgi:hypothetical protein
MDWTHILAYVTGTVDQELLARNEYLAAENRILKSQSLALPHRRPVAVGDAHCPAAPAQTAAATTLTYVS